MGNFSNAKAITFFDTELTNLDPEKSALLDITIITDWSEGGTETWSTKVKPTKAQLKKADPEALKIVGYNEEDWKNAPSIDEVAETIVKKLTWGPICAHNAVFDYRHLTEILKRAGWEEVFMGKTDWSKKQFSLSTLIYDTRALAHIYLDSERQNMAVLRERFELTDEGAHTSQKDTEDCRTIFYNIISETMQ